MSIPKTENKKISFENHALTRKKAAERLGVCPATLAKWARESRGPKSIKLGKTQQSRHIYLVSEIERFLDDPQKYEAERLAGS